MPLTNEQILGITKKCAKLGEENGFRNQYLTEAFRQIYEYYTSGK